jgi:hypothetical protein
LVTMDGNLTIVCFLTYYFSIQKEMDYINEFNLVR